MYVKGFGQDLDEAALYGSAAGSKAAQWSAQGAGGYTTSFDYLTESILTGSAEGLPVEKVTYVDPDPETTIYAEEQPEAEPVKVATEQQQQEPPAMTDPAPPVGGGSALPLIAGVAVVAYLLAR